MRNLVQPHGCEHEFRAGARLGEGLAVASAVYVATTHDDPHRLWLAALTALALALAACVRYGPAQRWLLRQNLVTLMTAWRLSFY